ncbi:MAG: EscU/YscU/HrcU family type III secretion system export apparatus switch protein [Myxococcales bacterium]|nr:EscU/YscU/HrcU family type III secretion system export apparatus switch protein [Myxococcales bacterium]
MSNQDKSQKTQKPTPKRISEFRKKGKVAMSKDLSSVSLMLMGGALGLSYSDGITVAISSLMRSSLQAGPNEDVSRVFLAGVRTFFTACWPVMIGGLIGVIAATMMQLGWPPALKKLKFEPGKPFKMGGLKDLISLKAAGGRVLKATAKAGLVMVVLMLVIVGEYEAFIAAPTFEATALASTVFGAIGKLGFYSVLVLGALALIDFGFQKKKIMDEMMMSVQDLKDEHKKQEGDPLLRGKRKQKMRELAQRRVKSEVQGADVVIVNPTHYSIALRYDDKDGGAPRVVAKGKDELAAKMREFARQAGVPILERPSLTRLIYRLVPEGREIPAELYQAVAEILAYVYKLKLPRRAV